MSWKESEDDEGEEGDGDRLAHRSRGKATEGRGADRIGDDQAGRWIQEKAALLGVTQETDGDVDFEAAVEVEELVNQKVRFHRLCKRDMIRL